MKRLTRMVVVAGVTVATLGFGACKSASERQGSGGSGRNVETQQGTGGVGTYGGTSGSEPFPGMGNDAGIGGSGTFDPDAGTGGSGFPVPDAGTGSSGADFGTGTGGAGSGSDMGTGSGSTGGTGGSGP